MKTVSIVENYIKTFFFIECIITRHHQFNFIIKKYNDRVESEFGKEVKQGAVVMLKRLTEELDFRLKLRSIKSSKILAKSPPISFDRLYTLQPQKRF
jgi:hypothetical protein